MRLVVLTVFCAFRSSRGTAAKKTSTHGYLAGDPTTRTREAFRQGLHELGWVEGHNITVDYRWAEARPDWLSDLAGWKCDRARRCVRHALLFVGRFPGG